MSIPPEFIPIISSGMSIYSAISFFVIAGAAVMYFWWDRKEHTRLMNCIKQSIRSSAENINNTNSKVDLLFTKHDELIRDISYIKSHVAAIHESVAWVKESLKEK